MPKLFISWSGELSKAIAEELTSWIPKNIQAIKPFFSPHIQKGAPWAFEISQSLEECDCGIVCLTAENQSSEWVLFEAGSLSKKFDKSKVCVLLIGIEPTDIKGPLSAFQHTKFEKADFFQLMTTINNNLGDDKLDKDLLEVLYEKWWPDLEQFYNNCLETLSVKEKDNKKMRRTDRDILEEILQNTRNIRFESSSNDMFLESLLTSDISKMSDRQILSYSVRAEQMYFSLKNTIYHLEDELSRRNLNNEKATYTNKEVILRKRSMSDKFKYTPVLENNK